MSESGGEERLLSSVRAVPRGGEVGGAAWVLLSHPTLMVEAGQLMSRPGMPVGPQGRRRPLRGEPARGDRAGLLPFTGAVSCDYRMEHRSARLVADVGK